MPGTPSLSYYLMIIGGSLTIFTGIIVQIAILPRSYYGNFIQLYSPPFTPLVTSLETILPGLAVLYLGQRILGRPETQLTSSLAIIALSLVSVAAIVNSGATLLIGVFYSGPPFSFIGGVIGALSRTRKSSAVSPDPQSPSPIA